MKILQVSHSFIPCFDSGGVVRVVYEISKDLVARGHDVTVYTTDGCTKRLDVQVNSPVKLDGFKVYYFRNLSNWLRMKLKLATPYAMFGVIRSEVKYFDIIHIHEHRTITAVIASHYAKKNKIPYIIQDHGSALPFFHKTLFKNVFDRIWGNNMLKHASKVIALTESEVDQYKEIGVDETKIEVVPNGIDIKEYHDIPKIGEFRDKYAIGADEKIVLYLGRLNRSKGIDLLIRAFYNLLTEFKNVKLVIVGPDDGFLLDIKNLVNDLGIEDKVLLTGPLYHKDKMGAYIDANVFVTPNFSGFPITFLESCACKLPLITTKMGDDLEWIDGNVGFVTEYEEISLEKAILSLLSDESLNEKFGLNGLKLVQNRFNWETITKDLERLYQSLI